ncbi:MAG: hypothetical protein NZM13_09935 [Cyclobacteriaceae bacterium]|nr:hypothetical protein [Cyclobacteriaceae bacterium]MDW8330631.1 hypothetical protein [Cyclobacteriaceae bacterium]
MVFRFFISLCALSVFVSKTGLAQSFVENALIFSRTQPGGSARMQAMGGAQVALGGDYSSALSNPAGLGMFNRSEFTFTPALSFNTIDASHFGSTTPTSNSFLNIPGASYVIHKPGSRNEFPSSSLAITVTRINSFNREFNYRGTDNISSITDWFIERATGYAPEQLPSPYRDIPLLNFEEITGQAYMTYLINTLADDPTNTTPVMPDDYINYYSELEALPGETRTLSRTGKVKTRGAQYQWSVAYGGNYRDKLFYGATFGIHTLRYEFERTYGESNFEFSDDPSYNPLDFLELSERISIEGTGASFALGVIYRPVDYIQVGVSWITPTWYQLSDLYTSSVTANWNDSRGLITEQTRDGLLSEYAFRTPGRLTLGTAWFVGSHGFITADLEWINFGNARYRSQVGDISFAPDNEGIQQNFKNVINYRIGAEFRKSIFRLRAGLNYQANPLLTTLADYRILTYSMGAGIRLKTFYSDLAVLRSSDQTQYSPFVFSDGSGPAVDLSRKATTVMITFGFTF